MKFNKQMLVTIEINPEVAPSNRSEIFVTDIYH